MAEDTCISVVFADNTHWNYCWSDVHPDPTWIPGDVVTGLRPNVGGEARAWRTCQFYLKGMSSICANFAEGTPSDAEGTTTSGSYFCSYVKSNTSDDANDPKPAIPTGFNNSHCDFLGRRQWCSHYEGAGTEDLEEWICAGPNPYLTGLGEKTTGGEAAVFRPVTRDSILGYNDDGSGVGQCDCYGMGRGEQGCGVAGDTVELALSKLPIVCNFYRPFQMGFGIIDPAKKYKGDVESDRVTITEQGWKNAQAWEDDVSYRLPLNYELYNKRAEFQKCQWWDEDIGREYLATDDGTNIYLEGSPDIFDASGRVEFCKCTDSAANDFNTRLYETQDEDWQNGAQTALKEVWALGGGPVCNGARAGCPCYSGKWEYLQYEKMLPGMPVTANQILELRFWVSDWDSQQEYDDYFSKKPNFDDAPTPEIYTFTKWANSSSPEYSHYKMLGKKLKLCQPAPLHHKEFTTDYIISEDVEYFTGEIGTDTSEQRHFPTLIRDPYFVGMRPLVVTYPYYNDSAFDADICTQPGAPGNTKRHNNMYGDGVKTIGQTLRSRKVYVINTAQIHVDTLLHNFTGVYSVRGKKIKDANADTIKNKIYDILRETVTRGFKNDPDYINDASSDAVFGYFLVGSVKLKYNQVNFLLVCVDFGDGTWEYRWRQVNSLWCGGLIKQIDYTHEYSEADAGYSNPQPESLGGAASAIATAIFLSGTDEVDMLSTYSVDNVFTNITYYSWSMQEVYVEDEFQEYWTAIGNSNKILVEISDLDINYVYDWDVEAAYLRAIPKDEEDGQSSSSVPDEIQLKKILVNDDNIPPNACLLEPQDDIRIRFLSSEWELYVSYKHDWLTNEDTDENILDGANKDANHRYSTSPYSLNSSEGVVIVDDIDKGAVQLMAHFKDFEGRIISSFATKLLINIVREGCRSVDIYYRYEALAKKYGLEPATGMCIDTKKDLAIAGDYKHVETPNCGDHEHSWATYEGPMWFPFNVCRGYDMYDEFTICNNCQAGYVGPLNDGVNKAAGLVAGQVVQRFDYRYCGPYKYDAYGTVRGNWATTCDCGCTFSYTDASASVPTFAGYARIRTTVDLKEYSQNDWVPPKFGNEGREFIEKYISQDFISHFVPYVTAEEPLPVRKEWMPLMLDHSVFFSTFNAYDNNIEDEYLGVSEYYSLEPFRYTNQLNMALLSDINEEMIDDKRYRWEELFELHHEGNCSYPYPHYPTAGGTTQAVFYYLKEPWAAWAWQEAWRDIKRNAEGALPETEASPDSEGGPVSTDLNKLDFLELVKPLYVTGVYKEEHRRIIDEGNWPITYKGPVLDEDGNVAEHPSLNLTGEEKFQRAFEIMYDEDSYTSTNPVIWKDEGGSSKTSASSDEDNIYEKTRGDEWVHHENAIFDEQAEDDIDKAGEAGRKLAVSIDLFSEEPEYKYYNRGLVVDMTRDRLYHLPKQETDQDIVLTSSEYVDGIPGVAVWQTSFVSISEPFDQPVSISKVCISGYWGYVDVISEETEKIISRELVYPGVSITCSFNDGSSGEPRSQVSAKSDLVYPTLGQDVEKYNICLYFLLGPVEMIKKKTNELIIELEGSSGSFISLDSITVSTATYLDIRYEYVNVYERKYIASEFTDPTAATIGINLDGPGDNLHYQTDLHNSGQYVDLKGAKFKDEQFTAMDKTKYIGASFRYAADEPIEISYDTLHEIERTVQKELYMYIYDELDQKSDSLDFDTIMPYKYKSFLEELGVQFSMDNLTIKSEILTWEKHKLVKQFKQYDYWRPGGHYYSWTTKFTKQKCWSFGAPEDYFTGYYHHVDHVGVGNPLEADASKPIDIGNSYYSLRFYTAQAKYNRAVILAGGEPSFEDRRSGAVFYNAGTFTGG